jgi:hypothetical protein
MWKKKIWKSEKVKKTNRRCESVVKVLKPFFLCPWRSKQLSWSVWLWAQSYKPFYDRNLRLIMMYINGKPFQPCLMFVSSLIPPKIKAQERCFTRVSYCLTQKYLTRLKKPARDKHSRLLWKLVNCWYNFLQYWDIVICVNEAVCGFTIWALHHESHLT